MSQKTHSHHYKGARVCVGGWVNVCVTIRLILTIMKQMQNV